MGAGRRARPERGGGAQVVANGTSHSGEGLKLEEVALRAGDAQLLVRGALLGAAQARARASRRSAAGLAAAMRCAARSAAAGLRSCLTPVCAADRALFW